MASGFLRKSVAKSVPQPWTSNWVAGPMLSKLFDIYPSKGDVTIGAQTLIPSVSNGPIQVVRYGALTVNALLSVTNRCRGLCVLCDSLSMGASGHISMSFLGATGTPDWVNQDILIPTNLRFNGKNTPLSEHLSWLGSNGYAVFDPTLYALPPKGMGDVVANHSEWPGNGTAIISKAGCGTGGARIRGSGADSGSNGNNGSAGVNAPGGGGGGGRYSGGGGYTADGGAGGPGVVWSGGAAGLGSYEGYGWDGWSWGGPSVTNLGPGGVLFVICRGNITLTAGHRFSADATTATTTYHAGPGGGFVGIYYGGTLSGTLSATANGGGFASWGSNGGGGVAVSKTFAQMGWV